MNKQQAINLLKNLEQSLDDYCELNDEGKTAFRMAITALNCSEFPNSSDTISRQQAIDAILAVTGNSSVRELYEHVQEHGLSEMWSGGVSAAIDVIIAVPSAQPEPSDVARSIATIIENEQDMRVVLKNAQNDIVHCRDCKFCHKSPDWKHRQSFGESIWYCEENRGFNFAQTVGLDDYCSSAERRADEQTD